MMRVRGTPDGGRGRGGRTAAGRRSFRRRSGRRGGDGGGTETDARGAARVLRRLDARVGGVRGNSGPSHRRQRDEDEAADERRDGARAGAHRWRDSPESGGPLQRPPEGAGDTSRLMRAEQLSEAGSAAASGLTEAEARRLLKQRRPVAPAADEQVLREHRPRQRLHRLQPDPRRLRRAHARLRRLARLAVPRHPRRQLGDRDRPGGARQARARPARAARRAERATLVRDGQRARHRRGRGGRRRPASGDEPGDQVVADGEVAPQRRPARRRVDPDRRVARRRTRAGRGAPLRLVRRRRRAAPSRSRPSAREATPSASSARRASSAIRARRCELAVNRLLYVLVAFVVVLGGLLGFSLWHRQASINDAVSTSTAGVVTMIPEGLIALVEPHLRGRRGADGPPRRAGPAAQRDRVARVGGHDLPRQDRHADRVEPARRGRDPRRRSRARAG